LLLGTDQKSGGFRASASCAARVTHWSLGGRPQDCDFRQSPQVNSCERRGPAINRQQEAQKAPMRLKMDMAVLPRTTFYCSKAGQTSDYK
jgi:hypothetical protein